MEEGEEEGEEEEEEEEIRRRNEDRLKKAELVRENRKD